MRGKTTFAAAALAALALLAAGCGGGKDEPDTKLTPAQKDSVLSESALPGAGAVKGALDVADSAQVRADREDAAAAGR